MACGLGLFPPALPAAPPAGYYLVWSDEFNGTALDPTKWWVWDQPDRSGYTTPDAVTEGGGYLTLHTYTTNGVNYSPILSTDGFFRPRYGYTESSVQFNGSPGMFSDFWIQSAINGVFLNDPAASGAEVDICEHRVTDAADVDDLSGEVTIDLHWNGYGSAEKTASSGLTGSGLGTGFHTYGLLWSSNNYNVSIDGVSTWTTNVGIAQRTEILMLSSEVDSNSFCGIVPTGGYGNFLASTTSSRTCPRWRGSTRCSAT
jgi:beta-glucanase (GH16 family)